LVFWPWFLCFFIFFNIGCCLTRLFYHADAAWFLAAFWYLCTCLFHFHFFLFLRKREGSHFTSLSIYKYYFYFCPS
jgi:hypothetical protein